MAGGRAGTKRGSSSSGGEGLDPSTRLALADAALLVGVDVERLERLCRDGSLLFETERRRKREVRFVRLIDLAEAFPDALGPLRATTDEPPAAGVELAATADASMAEAVRASGASRDALIVLCQDLEERLDLAERERQASTASLLMAQRRILDLELQSRSRPWSRAGGAALGLLSVAAIVLAIRVPSLVREETSAGLAAVRSSVEAAAAAEAVAREDIAERVAEGATAVEQSRQAVENVVREAQRQREVARDEEEARAAAILALEERLEGADAQVARRTAELDLLVEASSRDRARFAERLAAAERVADDLRAQLTAERRASADEHAAFEQRLDGLLRSLERAGGARAVELRQLRDLVEQGLEREPPADDSPTEAEAAARWADAFRAIFGG